MAQTQISLTRHDIEDSMSTELWLDLRQYPENWDRHQDIVTWILPSADLTWLVLRHPDFDWSRLVRTNL